MDSDEDIDDIDESTGQIEVQFKSETGIGHIFLYNVEKIELNLSFPCKKNTSFFEKLISSIFSLVKKEHKSTFLVKI